MLTYKPQLQFHHLYWTTGSVILTLNWKWSSESSRPATNFLYQWIRHHPWFNQAMQSNTPYRWLLPNCKFFENARNKTEMLSIPKCCHLSNFSCFPLFFGGSGIYVTKWESKGCSHDRLMRSCTNVSITCRPGVSFWSLLIKLSWTTRCQSWRRGWRTSLR